MPVLTFSLNAQGQAPNGKTVVIPPTIALVQRGPVVQVSINLEQSMQQVLLQQGKQVPTPESGWALIDTGASVTCIDDAVAAKLALPAIDKVQMCSASHANTMQNVYPVQILISGLNYTINVPRAMGASLAPQGIVALIGRDVLQTCTMFYNGLNGEVTISI